MITCLIMNLSSEQDRVTFRVLYEKTVNRFLAVAKSILNNQDDAEEIVQDVYTNWMNDYNTYRNKTLEEMTGLGVVMVRNKALNPKNRKEKYMESPIEDVEIYNTDLYYNNSDILDEVIRNERIEQLKDVLKSLTEDEQMILMLKYELEMSYREIAKAMKIKENTVKIKLARTKKKLYSKLKTQD